MLTAVDGEAVPSRPVEVGADLADRYDTDHVVLHVMPRDVFDEFREETDRGDVPAGPSQASYGTGGSHDRSTDSYSIEDGERHARGVVRDVVRGTLDDWEAVVRQGRVGDPVDEILAEADRRDATFLVVGGRQRSPVGKAVFGSTTQSVLLGAERPVVTVMNE